MTRPIDEKPVSGPLAPSDEAGLGTLEWGAGGLSLLWVLAVPAYVWSLPEGPGAPGLVLVLLAVVLPLALIWAVVLTLRAVRTLRAEAARLQSAVEAMRGTQSAGGGANAARTGVERRPEDQAPAARPADPAGATFQTRRDAGLTQASADRKAALVPPRPAAAAEEQPGLALGTPPEDLRAPLSVADFIRALQFPESPDDKAGFRALRLALEDRNASRLIRAAQDVLTLLSQEGIYMDDLTPDRARPELWRRFAAGERGRTIAALGGIRDRSSLALTAARMREDAVFRDAGHHFLRAFDKCFAAFEPQATDEDLAELADTRTARAFMLFGRVTGTFD